MTDKKQNILFVVCAYTFFWVFLAIAAVFLTIGIIPDDEVPMNILITIGSWIPTMALLVLFKKLYQNKSIKDFYKNAFKERLNWKIFLIATIVFLLIIVCTAGIVAIIKKVPLLSLFDLSLRTIVIGFVWSLIQVSGEESGWRGYLQLSLEKRLSVIKSSIIIGIIWAFWHLPMWFITGYTGWDLIKYILLFVPYCLSGSVIIGICYDRCRNLIVPIWMHFLASFFLIPLTADPLDISWIALFYILAAIGYIIWYKKIVEK